MLPGIAKESSICWGLHARVSHQSQQKVDRLRCCAQHAISRREITALIAAPLVLHAPASSAGIIDDYVERSQRPEMTQQQALIKLLDARGILYELKELAASDPKSKLRFDSRALLPGMAKTLRQVGKAAPVIVAEVLGDGNRRAVVSKLYGGKAENIAAARADPVYQAIGQVITISGRTIKNEAQASPEYAVTAIDRINDLLALLPDSELEAAQQIRKARSPTKLVKRTDVSDNLIAA